MNIAVYGAPVDGNDASFQNIAEQLGTGLSVDGHTLLIEDAEVGLLGKTVSIAMQHGSSIRHSADATEEADACIFLPGGMETMGKALHILHLCDDGAYLKPVIMLNANGCWEPLKQMIAHMDSEAFLSKKLDNVFFCNDFESIRQILK